MDEDAAAATSVLKRLAKPSDTMSVQDSFELAVFCEASKYVMQLAAEELVEEAQGMPILNSKSCDGTPISVMHRTTRTLPSGTQVKTSGRAGKEFLVKNQFLRVQLPTGEWDTRPLLQEPVALEHGKSAPAIMAACWQDWKSLRQLRHTGCCVEHFAADRAGLSALDRLVRQWHQHQPVNLPTSVVSPEIARLCEFVVVTPCAIHDSQNVFKRGMHEDFSNRDMMRDIYIAIESLRNTADVISEHMASWVSSRLKFVDDRGPDWVAEQQQVWMALGVELEQAELLSERLQYCFEDGNICIHNNCMLSGDVTQVICATLLGCWRWIKFTESRWLTVGYSSRHIVTALLTGVEDMVRWVEKTFPSRLGYLRGFHRLQVKGRKEFVCQAALYSRVTEGFMSELLEDARVARVYDRLWAAASEEMRWLVDLSPGVWQILGRACGLAGIDFADRCIHSGHISFHFLWRRVLQPASEMPWSLCRGDIKANLIALKLAECPGEPMSKQLWQLLQLNFPLAQLEKKTVALLQEVSWSTLVAEQQHASSAQLRKVHPSYSASSLCSRALLLQVNRLMPKPSAEEKRLEAISRRLQKIDSSNAWKASGRHEFLKSLIALTKKRKDNDEDQSLKDKSMKSLAQHWFARHAALWAKQSVKMKVAFTQRAAQASLHRTGAPKEEEEDLLAELEVITSRMQDGADESGPITMSSAAFTPKFVASLGELLSLEDFRARARMEEVREKVTVSPLLGRPSS